MGLFTPGWKSKNEAKALQAVTGLADGETLFKAACESPHVKAGLAAVERLNDGRLLFRIAAAPRSESIAIEIKRAAMAKLTEAALNDLLKSQFADAELEHEAVERISDPVLLNDAASTAYYGTVRELACERLGGHIYPDDVAAGIHHCSRCGKEQFVLDADAREKAKRYAAPKTSDEWENEALHTVRITELTKEHCYQCKTVTPHLRTTALKYEIYKSTGKPTGKTVWMECLVCHNRYQPNT